MKRWYQSKTIWFNALAFLTLLANAFGFVDFQADPAVEQLGTAVVILINLALRWVTATKVR